MKVAREERMALRTRKVMGLAAAKAPVQMLTLDGEGAVVVLGVEAGVKVMIAELKVGMLEIFVTSVAAAEVEVESAIVITVVMVLLHLLDGTEKKSVIDETEYVAAHQVL